MHELISPYSSIDPLVTRQSGVWCKRTGVSPLVVNLYSLYRCRLVHQTPYACSPAIYGSVLTVVMHRCLRLSLCSSSDIGGGHFFSNLVFLELNC